MRSYTILIITALFTFTASGVAQDFGGIEDEILDIILTRDPENHPTRSIEDTRSDYNYGAPYSAVDVYNSQSDKGNELILYINSILYPDIQDSLTNDFIPAAEADGWSVSVTTISGGDEVALRNTMKNDYDNVGYFYGILIGNLPVPLFDVDNDSEGAFPCDLFYMDVDGEWRDDVGSGSPPVYDYHGDGSGDIEADIPVARWTTATLTLGALTEAELIENYIDKNVIYRAGNMIPDEAGLAYVDDDWSYWGPSWGGAVDTAFPGTEIVYDIYETNADDYEDNRLPTSYEHILACVHSYSGGHAWYVNGPYDWTTSYELHNIKSRSISYNMFACANSRYTENNYMGGWYCFMDNEWGVFGIGCTKSGSMLNFNEFYTPLSTGKTYGESFQEWFAGNAETGAGGDSRGWFYGMTLNGDPTLMTLEYTTAVALHSFSADPRRDAVKLTWEYSDEGEYVGFNLYRRERTDVSKTDLSVCKGCEVKLNDGLIVGASPITFTDNDVAFDTDYEYRLEMVVNSHPGEEATAGVHTGPATKTSFALNQPYPNPATSAVTFEYVIPENTRGYLSVFDITGRKVYSVELSDNEGTFEWNTVGDNGYSLSNGIYAVKLSAGENTAVKKFLISR
ncbi:MAG: T9SS type A sorting domain-containing protein [bacterium]|nr:T9SS type A sorting domain-containing protein [bacterium]